MRITRVVFAFFAIGFLAGSFERAAGLGDPERPKRMADVTWTPQSRAPRKLVLASVGPIGSRLPEMVLASIKSSADPTLEAAGAAWSWSASTAEPMAKADGLPLAVSDPAAQSGPSAPPPGRQEDAERAGQRTPCPNGRRRCLRADGRVGHHAARLDGRQANARDPATARTQEFIMPFERGRVTSLFHQGRYHPAIDLAGSLGSTVHSTTRKQRVTFAGWRGGYGNAVITRDELGRTHLYGHLLRIFATVGSILDQGQKLGALGSTGHSTGPHVHYEVRNKAGAPHQPGDAAVSRPPGRPRLRLERCTLGETRQGDGRAGSAASAIGRDALVGEPDAVGRRARSARTRRSACRRAGTSSRRCAGSAARAARRGACRWRPCSPRGRRRGCGRRRDRASATWIPPATGGGRSRSPGARSRAGR